MFASGGMPSSHLAPVLLSCTMLLVLDDTLECKLRCLMIVADMFQGHPVSKRKLKELLDHTPSQVIVSALVDCLTACLCCRGHVLVG
ncbi:unnamed protein product [Lathyrus oleraceus]